MSFYKDGFNLERDIRRRKDNRVSNPNVYITNVVNNVNTQVNDVTSGSTVNVGPSNQTNTVSNTSTGVSTGNDNIIDSNSHIVGGENNNIQGDNIFVNSVNNTIIGDNVNVIGGGDNFIDASNNVVINTTNQIITQDNSTVIGGDIIYNTSNISPLIHILYGVENGFNELKHISFVMGGHNTTRPLWGDDNNHIVDGNAINILYQQ